jgi:hypothetical protein
MPSISVRDQGSFRRVDTEWGKRSVLVFGNRLLEVLVYLVVGLVFLVLGLVSANVNYQVLFFILTAFFIFAIFRPTSLP